MLLFGDQIGDVLGRMPRRVFHRQDGFAKGKLIAVLELFGLEPVARAALVAGIDLGRSDAIAQLARAADQIGVNVRFEDVSDR